MERRMVMVKNNYDSQVGVIDPLTGMKMRWQKRGQSLPIPFETLQQLVYQDGFRRMLDQGILYIESMQDKKDLALEPQEAEKPTNLISLSEIQIKNFLTTMPIDVCKRELSKLPDTQIDNIIDYAISHEILDAAKCKLLKEVTGRDILAIVSRKQEMEAAEKREQEKAAMQRIRG